MHDKFYFPFLFLFLFFFTARSHAQRYEDQHKLKIYWATVYDENQATKGVLYAVNDSEVVLLTQSEYLKYKMRKDYKATSIRYDKIYLISVAREGRFLRALGIASLSGLVIGGAIGLAGGDSPPGDPNPLTKKDKMFIGGGAGLIVGMITGFVIGTIHSRYVIHNDAETFKMKQPSLQRKSVQGI